MVPDPGCYPPPGHSPRHYHTKSEGLYTNRKAAYMHLYIAHDAQFMCFDYVLLTMLQSDLILKSPFYPPRRFSKPKGWQPLLINGAHAWISVPGGKNHYLPYEQTCLCLSNLPVNKTVKLKAGHFLTIRIMAFPRKQPPVGFELIWIVINWTRNTLLSKPTLRQNVFLVTLISSMVVFSINRKRQSSNDPYIQPQQRIGPVHATLKLYKFSVSHHHLPSGHSHSIAQ